MNDIQENISDRPIIHFAHCGNGNKNASVPVLGECLVRGYFREHFGLRRPMGAHGKRGGEAYNKIRDRAPPESRGTVEAESFLSFARQMEVINLPPSLHFQQETHQKMR